MRTQIVLREMINVNAFSKLYSDQKDNRNEFNDFNMFSLKTNLNKVIKMCQLSYSSNVVLIYNVLIFLQIELKVW